MCERKPSKKKGWLHSTTGRVSLFLWHLSCGFLSLDSGTLTSGPFPLSGKNCTQRYLLLHRPFHLLSLVGGCQNQQRQQAPGDQKGRDSNCWWQGDVCARLDTVHTNKAHLMQDSETYFTEWSTATLKHDLPNNPQVSGCVSNEYEAHQCGVV